MYSLFRTAGGKLANETARMEAMCEENGKDLPDQNPWCIVITKALNRLLLEGSKFLMGEREFRSCFISNIAPCHDADAVAVQVSFHPCHKCVLQLNEDMRGFFYCRLCGLKKGSDTFSPTWFLNISIFLSVEFRSQILSHTVLPYPSVAGRSTQPRQTCGFRPQPPAPVRYEEAANEATTTGEGF